MDGYSVAVIEDRYGGTYSHGRWLAIDQADRLDSGAYRIIRCLEDGPNGDDTDAVLFWSEPPEWIAVGNTPDEAVAALKAKLASGSNA